MARRVIIPGKEKKRKKKRNTRANQGGLVRGMPGMSERGERTARIPLSLLILAENLSVPRWRARCEKFGMLIESAYICKSFIAQCYRTIVTLRFEYCIPKAGFTGPYPLSTAMTRDPWGGGEGREGGICLGTWNVARCTCLSEHCDFSPGKIFKKV